MTIWRALLLLTAACYGIAVTAIIWAAYSDPLGVVLSVGTGVCSAIGWYWLWEEWV